MASNPPFNIPIGTSDPLDLSSGLPLFPGLGTARAGIAASSRSYKLFDIPILIICTRLKLTLYGGYGFGIVGPAIAFLSKDVSVARDNIGNEGQLTLTFKDGLQMEAGAFMGAYVSGGVTATLQVYLPRPWYKVWAFTWVTAFTIRKDFKIDLLKLLFKLISYLLSKKPDGASFKADDKNKLQETKLGVQGFSMVGNASGVTRNLRATPELVAPINIANYIPNMREVNLLLAKIDGEISFGPAAHLQYPVTFNFTGFTVEGSVLGASEADYDRGLEYLNRNQVTARGNRQFNLRENPSKFTTHVEYQTSVRLGLSIFAKVKVAKFFSIGTNTPSLDLTFLLYRRPEDRNGAKVPNKVTSNVGGGCVLTPNMTLRFQGPDNTLEIRTGQLAKGRITLAGFQMPKEVTVGLTIEPSVDYFPTSVKIPAGANSIEFPFTFRNQFMLTGNRDNLSELASPSALSPLQDYRVRATLLEDNLPACSDYQADSPLSITNRFIRCQRFLNTAAGAAPLWDPLASATIKGDINDPNAPGGQNFALALLWFPYVSTEQPQTVPVTFTLLDENREPYSRSSVEILAGGDRKLLTPSCTLNVTLLSEQQAPNARVQSFVVQWLSKGKHTEYSNRFYLIVDAGCQYGQAEFWLDVYNWS